jgi:exoribonuclease-2
MSLDGRIIEYLENGKFICALVMEDMGSRLRLLNQNSRELNLPLNRVVHRSEQNLLPIPARQDIHVILEETAATRALLAEKINLAEIWETVAEKPEEAFTIEFLASLFYNTRPSDDQAAAFLRAVIAHRLYFKYKAGTIRVNSPETVALLQQNQEKEREEKQFIATNTAVLLRIRENGRPQPDWKDQHRVLRLLADYYLFSKDAADHELARRLVKNSGLTGPHDICRQGQQACLVPAERISAVSLFLPLTGLRPGISMMPSTLSSRAKITLSAFTFPMSVILSPRDPPFSKRHCSGGPRSISPTNTWPCCRPNCLREN